MDGWVVERIARNILNSAPKIIPMKMSTDGHHQDTRRLAVLILMMMFLRWSRNLIFTVYISSSRLVVIGERKSCLSWRSRCVVGNWWKENQSLET